MSKYIKLDDAIGVATRGTNNYFICKALKDLPTIEVSEEQLSKLQTSENSVENTTVSEDFTSISRANSKLEVSEEDELKFYYVDSIDDYWIGQRLDRFYYAKWDSKLGFVWSASRYLPWGEHVVAPDTLWKEHTYPSEPREMPFTEWIVGFMKKYGSEVSEDCISRVGLFEKMQSLCTETDKGCGDCHKACEIEDCMDLVMNAPSVIPQQKEGEWYRQTTDHFDYWECSECGMGVGLDDIKNYCPNCGAKMKGAEE